MSIGLLPHVAFTRHIYRIVAVDAVNQNAAYVIG